MAEIYKKLIDDNLIFSKYAQFQKQNKDINFDHYKKELKSRIRRLKKCPYFENDIYDEILYLMIKDILSEKINFKIEDKYFYESKKNLSKILVKANNSKFFYSINLKIESIKNIDTIINYLKIKGFKDNKFLMSIKHFLSKDNAVLQSNKIYILLFGELLGLIQEYLDQNLSEPDSNFSRFFQNNKNNLKNKMIEKGRNPSAKYCFNFDEFLLLTNSRTEQIWILEMIQEYLNKNKVLKNLEINFKTDYNKLKYRGYSVIKQFNQNKKYILIVPSDIDKIKKEISSMKWRTPIDIKKSLIKIIFWLNRYDICNNVDLLLSTILLKLVKVSTRKQSLLKKIKNKSIFYYKEFNSIFTIDLYELRKYTKLSFKEYIFDNNNLKFLSYLKDPDLKSREPYNFYKTLLWKKQKGIDYSTNKNLFFTYIDIHHIDGNHFNNKIDNLVLISKKNHRLIHSSIETNDKLILKFRKKLAK